MAYSGSVILGGYIGFTALSLVLTYTLSVTFGHVNAWLPYLSYLGNEPMESTIFTQCFVVDAAVLALVVQMRYVQVFRYLSKRKAEDVIFALNLDAAWTGHLAATGLFILACFQESHAFYVHYLAGVFLYFFGHIIYLSLQTLVSSKVVFKQRDVVLLKLRLAINALGVLFFLAFVGGYLIASIKFDRPWEERMEWSSSDCGWRPHIISVTSQWILLFLFLSYFLTFIYDFGNIHITKTQITVIVEN